MQLAEPVPAGTNDVFEAGADWLKWTQLVPEEETIANCWTEIIDVEQDDGRVLTTSTSLSPLPSPAILKMCTVSW